MAPITVLGAAARVIDGCRGSMASLRKTTMKAAAMRATVGHAGQSMASRSAVQMRGVGVGWGGRGLWLDAGGGRYVTFFSPWTGGRAGTRPVCVSFWFV